MATRDPNKKPRSQRRRITSPGQLVELAGAMNPDDLYAFGVQFATARPLSAEVLARALVETSASTATSAMPPMARARLEAVNTLQAAPINVDLEIEDEGRLDPDEDDARRLAPTGYSHERPRR